MGLIIWPVIIYAGAGARRLTWRAFGYIVFAAAILTVFVDFGRIRGAAALGEDQSFRFHPLVFLADVAVTSTLWALVYLTAFGAGAIYRKMTKHSAHRP